MHELLSFTLVVKDFQDEKEGDEDDGLNRGDEGKIVGQMAMILLDGE